MTQDLFYTTGGSQVKSSSMTEDGVDKQFDMVLLQPSHALSVQSLSNHCMTKVVVALLPFDVVEITSVCCIQADHGMFKFEL